MFSMHKRFHTIVKTAAVAVFLLSAGALLFAQGAAEPQEPLTEAEQEPAEGPSAEAVYAGGCFWGVEYYLEQLEGVYNAVSGYTGGTTENPTYYDVLSHTTGHVEAVRVTYNPQIISYEELTKYFFEIHDPTQTDGQGPDIGEQYLSVIFYADGEQKETAEKLIAILEGEGYDVATALREAQRFWPAELYHQNYYEIGGSLPYCHSYVKRFP